jgi:acetolactate synthase-1/2/3 large subunit
MALELSKDTGFIFGGNTLRGKGLEYAARLAAAGYRVFADRNCSRVEAGRGRFQPPRILYFPGPAQSQLKGLKDLVLVEAKAPVSFFGYPGEASYLAPDDCRVHTLAGIDEDGLAALEALELPEAGFTDPDAAVLPAGDGPLTLEMIGVVLAALLPEDAIICDEMVSSGPPVLEQLQRARRYDYLPVTGGSIGQAMPVGVGAAVACPGRKVVVLEGDGSAVYTPQALWTMARESLDVVTVVFNNRRYRILDIEMRRTGASGFGEKSNEMVDLRRPELDFVQLAGSMGVRASKAQSIQEFVEQFRRAVAEPGPYLIEALV